MNLFSTNTKKWRYNRVEPVAVARIVFFDHRSELPKNSVSNHSRKFFLILGIIIYAFMLFVPTLAIAQICTTTVPAGTVVNETWTTTGSPYCVTGDIGVSLLTIEPGVEVLVDGLFQIEILSTITVTGTEAAPVVFSAKDTNVRWKGIKFDNTTPGSRLSHCVVEYSNDSGIKINNSNPIIENCSIRNNTAQSGAGMDITLDADPPLTLELTDNTITDNASTLSGNLCNGAGTGNGGGGGIRAVIDTGMLIIQGSEITNNTAGVAGNRGHRSGSGVFINGNVTIRDSLISGNETFAYNCPCGPGSVTSVASGAGIHATGDIVIENTIINNNLVDAKACFTGSGIATGSGIYFAEGQLELKNSVVSYNTADGNGPGNTAARRSSVFVTSGSTNITNSNLAFNDSFALRSEDGTTVSVINSILYFNNSGGEQLSGTVTTTYSDIQGDYLGEGNIDVNPAFSSEDDLAIVPGSPAIDKGNPNSIFNDVCFPPSLGTIRNDMGAHGGPGACGWPGAIEPPPNIIFLDGFENN